MSAWDDLVERFRESGHVSPVAAALFATGGSEERAAEIIAELDAPRQQGLERLAWRGTDERGASTG